MRRRRRGYRSASWCNKRGLPNKAEQAVINLSIPGLVCLVGNRDKYVLLRRPVGPQSKRWCRWETPDVNRVWRKHPDFAFGWSSDKPRLVVEVFGFGKYHTVKEAYYLKKEYARAGVLCLIFSCWICKRDPAAVKRRITNAIRSFYAKV